MPRPLLLPYIDSLKVGDVHNNLWLPSFFLPEIEYPGHHFKEEITDDEMRHNLQTTVAVTIVVGEINNDQCEI